MPSDSERVNTAPQQIVLEDVELALDSFESESEIGPDHAAAAPTPSKVDLFPSEEADDSEAMVSSVLGPAVALPAAAAVPVLVTQSRTPAAALAVLAIVGLAVGIWSGRDWTITGADASPDRAPIATAPVASAPATVPESELTSELAASPAPLVETPPARTVVAERPAIASAPTREAEPPPPIRLPAPAVTRPANAVASLPPRTAPASPPPPPSRSAAAVPTPSTPIATVIEDKIVPSVSPPERAEAAPPPSDASAPPVITAAAPSPGAAPAAPAAPPTAAAASAGAVATADIRAVLMRYASAFSALDSNAVQSVWPTVDARALSRAFRGLEQQAIAFDGCTITPAAASAEASCAGTLRYVARIGSKSPRTEQRRWTFSMRKAGEHWVIENVSSR